MLLKKASKMVKKKFLKKKILRKKIVIIKLLSTLTKQNTSI